MRLQNVRRIVVEDFPTEQKDLVERIALILNPFMESIVSLSENNINFDNLAQELITFKITVKNGIPVKDSKFSTTKFNNAHGGIVISAVNTTTPSNYPTTSPFISFSSVSDKLYKINNITGLQDNQEYELKVIIIGK